MLTSAAREAEERRKRLDANLTSTLRIPPLGHLTLDALDMKDARQATQDKFPQVVGV